jgi:hypothetical protein
MKERQVEMGGCLIVPAKVWLLKWRTDGNSP